MAKTVTQARKPDATAGTDAIYRSLFDSFNPDSEGRISPLIAAGVEPGTADYDGRTPLHLAAAEGQPEVVRYLLAAGAGPQPVDRWGGTPLSDAKAGGHTEIAAPLRERTEDNALLPRHADKREAAAV
jgi:glutaminase